MNVEMINENNASELSIAGKKYEDEKSGFYAGIIFFIWPLLSLILAFKDYRSNWGKNILWAFVAFYGLAFAIGTQSENSDIVRYVDEVEYLHGMGMSLNDAVEYYSESEEIDILRTFIAVTVSRFTDNQMVLTLIYGIIFGFFYSRNVWYVLQRLQGNMRLLTVLLFACFFLVIPMWNITTFRMWTAAHIFIYGVMPYLFEGKRRGVLIATLAILVHFSFIMPLMVLYAYMIAGNRVVLYFIFFIATLFVSEINLEVFNDFVESYAPEVIQERTSGYRNENYVESYREGGTSNVVWYAAWYARALKWAVMGFLIFLFIRGRQFFAHHENWLRMFSFILLFYGAANLLSSLPSGARFVSIANVLALALIILYIQNIEGQQMRDKAFIFSAPLLLLFLIVSVRMALYSLSATAILGNPVIAVFFNEDQISLNDVLLMLI